MEGESSESFPVGSREHAARKAAEDSHRITNHPELTEEHERTRTLKALAIKALTRKLINQRQARRAAKEASLKAKTNGRGKNNNKIT